MLHSEPNTATVITADLLLFLRRLFLLLRTCYIFNDLMNHLPYNKPLDAWSCPSLSTRTKHYDQITSQVMTFLSQTLTANILYSTENTAYTK